MDLAYKMSKLKWPRLPKNWQPMGRKALKQRPPMAVSHAGPMIWYASRKGRSWPSLKNLSVATSNCTKFYPIASSTLSPLLRRERRCLLSFLSALYTDLLLTSWLNGKPLAIEYGLKENKDKQRVIVVIALLLCNLIWVNIKWFSLLLCTSCARDFFREGFGWNKFDFFQNYSCRMNRVWTYFNEQQSKKKEIY